LKKQQEAEFNGGIHGFKALDPMAKVKEQKLLDEKNAEFKISESITGGGDKNAGTNECEKTFNNLVRLLEG